METGPARPSNKPAPREAASGATRVLRKCMFPLPCSGFKPELEVATLRGCAGDRTEPERRTNLTHLPRSHRLMRGSEPDRWCGSRPSTPSAPPLTRGTTAPTAHPPRQPSADVAVSVAVKMLLAPQKTFLRGQEHLIMSPGPGVIVATLRWTLEQAPQRSSHHRHRSTSGALHTGIPAPRKSRPTAAPNHWILGLHPTMPTLSSESRNRRASPAGPTVLRLDERHTAESPRRPHRRDRPQRIRESLLRTNQGLVPPGGIPNQNQSHSPHGLPRTRQHGPWRRSRSPLHWR